MAGNYRQGRPKIAWRLSRRFVNVRGDLWQFIVAGTLRAPANLDVSRRSFLALTSTALRTGAYNSGLFVRVGALGNKGAHYGIALVRRRCEARSCKWSKRSATYDDEGTVDGLRNPHFSEKSPTVVYGAASNRPVVIVTPTKVDGDSAQLVRSARFRVRKRRAIKCALRAVSSRCGAAYGEKRAERHEGYSLHASELVTSD